MNGLEHYVEKAAEHATLAELAIVAANRAKRDGGPRTTEHHRVLALAEAQLATAFATIASLMQVARR